MNRHRTGRRFRQHHRIRVGRICRTGRPAFGNQIRRTAREHQHSRRVVIDDIHGQARDRQPIVSATVILAATLHDRVLDVDGLPALRERVRLRHDRDGLREEPVGAVKHQRDTRCVGNEVEIASARRVRSELDAFAARAFVTLAQR